MGVSQIKFLEILKITEHDGKIYTPLKDIADMLKQKYGEPTASMSKLYFKINEKTSVVVVYQYCTIGCNVCKGDSFIRIDPTPALSYCLAAEPVKIGEELRKKDIKGLRNRLIEVVSKMGEPTGYTYSVQHRRSPTNLTNTGTEL